MDCVSPNLQLVITKYMKGEATLILSIHFRPESPSMLTAFNVGENSMQKHKVAHVGVRWPKVDIDVHRGRRKSVKSGYSQTGSGLCGIPR